ncbi:hypothetical protein BJY52DRAFT_1257584 [Lactarius psammicola]|nr:hypothetical protein BJY52DRAFT_1257584 [Lactarius psammicola]
MVTPDNVQQGVAAFSPNDTPAQVVEARAPPPVGRGRRSSTRTACQNVPYTYPRIPRPVIRQRNTPKATLDSQFQVNASHVQKPLSLVSNENRERGTLVSPARCNPVPEDGEQSNTRSPSGYEELKSNMSVTNLMKREGPCKRSRRRSPPTDSEDEDPFHFDSILSESSPPSKKDDSPGRTLSTSLFRRASIVPVDPSAAPAPHRFSLLREHASEGTIFVQEICDAEGRRWSLRVPASGLPEDMVNMLEELENLALELGQALPRIVVTCSAESLSSKRAAAPATGSAELLQPPLPTTVNAIDGGYSLAKEKCRLVEPEPEPICQEESAKFPATSTSVVVSSPSEQSLACIYLPELAPEFLSGSSTSPVLQPADGFHSKPPPPPTTSAHSSRQRAFFAALRDREPTRPTRSGIARRLAAAATARQPTEAKTKDTPASPPTPPRSRVPMKSALPVLKARSTAAAIAAPPLGTRTTQPTSDSRSPDPNAPPPLPGYSGPGTLPGAHAAAPAPAIATAGKPPYFSNTQQGNRGGGGGGRVVDERRSMPAPATPTPAAPAPSSARKLKHFFRRPPTRSASDPPAYTSVRRAAEGGVGVGPKRPASEVVQAAPREVVERSRMPRLPSARDLIRKLT